MLRKKIQKLAIPSLTFFLAIFSTNAFAYQENVSSGTFDIIVIPSSKMIDWSTPAQTARTYIKSILKAQVNRSIGQKDSPMGHVLMHFKCADINGTEHEEWSGFTGDKQGESAALVKRGHGFGVLFHDYVDGHVETPEAIQTRLQTFAKYNRGPSPLLLRFLIDKNQCSTITAHLRNFREATNTVYGFMPDPLTYKGAGCTSYVMSFFDVAKIKYSLFNNFKTKIDIAYRHIGNEYGNRSVKITDYLFKKDTWSKPGDSTRTLEFYDPQLMYNFMVLARMCAHTNSAYECEQAQKFLGTSAKFKSIETGLVKGSMVVPR